MDILLYVCGFLVLAIWLWSSILATIAVRHDATLESLQKKGQTVIVWLFPIVGAVFVLHLIWQHYPEAIPKTWIPWPLKNIVFGNRVSPNRNRNDNENDGINGSVKRDHYFESDGGGGD